MCKELRSNKMYSFREFMASQMFPSRFILALIINIHE